jgi:hypothetical protein
MLEPSMTLFCDVFGHRRPFLHFLRVIVAPRASSGRTAFLMVVPNVDALQMGHYRSNKLCPMYEQTYGKAAKVRHPTPNAHQPFRSFSLQPASEGEGEGELVAIISYPDCRSLWA